MAGAGLRGKGIGLDKILAPTDAKKRRTKVICTIGPSSWAVEKLIELIDAGMNVARLNFSHGDHGRHGETVAAIRKAAEARPGCHVAIMLDTKGSRTTRLLAGARDPSPAFEWNT